ALLQGDRLTHLARVEQPAQLHAERGGALCARPGRTASRGGASGEKCAAEQQTAERDTRALQQVASREIGEHRGGHACLLSERRAGPAHAAGGVGGQRDRRGAGTLGGSYCASVSDTSGRGGVVASGVTR